MASVRVLLLLGVSFGYPAAAIVDEEARGSLEDEDNARVGAILAD